jgi:NAD(P)-dependent dehydrogenase (short-subunit alcohol dehydrogenase family)
MHAMVANGALIGRVALVTGGVHGLGLSITRALRERGAEVAFADQNPDLISMTMRDLPGSLGIAGDVTLASDADWVVAAAVARFGRLDMLVNVSDAAGAITGESIRVAGLLRKQAVLC